MCVQVCVCARGTLPLTNIHLPISYIECCDRDPTCAINSIWYLMSYRKGSCPASSSRTLMCEERLPEPDGAAPFWETASAKNVMQASSQPGHSIRLIVKASRCGLMRPSGEERGHRFFRRSVRFLWHPLHLDMERMR